MSRQRSNYSSLDDSRDEADGREDDVESEQFTMPKKDDGIPWRTLFLVIFLFFGGLVSDDRYNGKMNIQIIFCIYLIRLPYLFLL